MSQIYSEFSIVEENTATAVTAEEIEDMEEVLGDILDEVTMLDSTQPMRGETTP